MRFLDHSELRNKHAFLSPSSYHWIRYTEDELVERYSNWQAAQRGTVLHAFAEQCIRLGQKLADEPKTLNMYVNDGIDRRMTPEQILFYSRNAFGCADTISFRKGKLNISDLKTGKSEASFDQLLVYSALFCLEYHMRPSDISMELRIYQRDECRIYEPGTDEIVPVMDKIKTFDEIIESMRQYNGEESDSDEYDIRTD